MRTRLALVLLLLWLAPTTVAAQGAPDLAPGARIRITAPLSGMQGRIGRLILIEADQLQVAFSPDTTTQVVPLTHVRRLEVSRGRGNTVGGGARGAGLGFLAGALMGAVIMQSAQDPNCSDCLGAVMGAAVGGGIGLGVGFLAGTAAQRERWTRVALGPQQPAAPTP